MAIDKIKLLQKVNPVEYMEKYLGIDVIKNGGTMTALSPFAPDKNPSLGIKQVSNDRWLITDWRLPANERNKNIIDVTMAVTGLDFYEAMEKINEDLKLGLDIKNPEMTNFNKELKRIFSMNEAAFDYYQKKMEEDINGQDYMKARGYSLKECKKYEIGFMPKYDNDFIPYMQEKGFNTDELLKGRLIAQNEKGQLYPNFSGRVMFSYKNKNGSILGFSGRAIENNVKSKYLNTPTIKNVFEKGNIMFNENNAIHEKAKKSIFVTEGFMDCLAYQKMIDNLGIDKRYTTVAVGTSAISDEQAKKLVKYKEVILSLDNDEAGKRGTRASIQKLVNGGTDVYILRPDDKKDFDEYYHSNLEKMSKMKGAREYFNNIMTASEYIAKEMSELPDREHFKQMCEFIKGINVEYRQEYLKDFNLDRPMNNWEVGMLAASFGIPAEYIPYILNPEHNPIDIKLKEKNLDKSGNITVDVDGTELNISFDGKNVTDIWADGNIDTSQVIDILLEHNLDTKKLGKGKFDYEIRDNKVVAKDRTNFENYAVFTVDRTPSVIDVMTSANNNILDVADMLRSYDIDVSKVEIISPDFRGNIKTVNDKISEKLGDIEINFNNVSNKSDSHDENFDIV